MVGRTKKVISASWRISPEKLMKKKERIVTIGLMVVTLVLAVLAIVTAYKIATRKPVAPTVPQKTPQAQTSAGSRAFSVGPALTSTPTPTGGMTPTSSPTPTGSLTPVQSPTPTGSLSPSPTLAGVPGATATPAPTNTPGLTATPTPLLGCYRECDSDDDCGGTLVCQTVSGVKRCVDLSCPGEKDCICNAACWGVCGQDSECPEDLRCRSVDEVYRCVYPDCEQEQDCECEVATTVASADGTTTPVLMTPTPVELPEAGISIPTIGAILGGIILTVVSLLVAL